MQSRGHFQRDKDGRLVKFAWPGGYPLIYLTKRSDVLCADCATDLERDRDAYDPVVGCDVLWEGDPIDCEGCSATIDSAYGPIKD